MSLWKNYLLAKSIPEAFEMMHDCPQPVTLIAGGTDLLLDIQQGRHVPPGTLVDISGIPELNRLEAREGRLFMGACVPVSDLARSALVIRHAQAVAEGCALIGGPQVRNVATLGGNVAHALPAADGMIGLVCMEAMAIVARREGEREVPILDLFKGPGKTALRAGEEILVGFLVEENPGNSASAFRRFMRPQGVALPILNMAIWLERDGGSVSRARVAIGPAGPTPRRASAVEQYLAGRPYDSANLDEACAILRETVHFRTSPFRATAEYRQDISATLFVDALTAAWERAGNLLEAK